MNNYIRLFFQPHIKIFSDFCLPSRSFCNLFSSHKLANTRQSIYFLFLLLMVSFSAVAVDLKEIQALVEADVPELALAMIDRHQPEAKNNPTQWMRWEKQRFRIYWLLKEYPELNKRTDNLPDKLPLSFYRWAYRKSILVHLLQGDGFAARNLAKKLLWGDYGKLEDKDIVEIRRLIIKSYLIENLPKDAYEAMQVHRKEFTKNKLKISFNENRAWSILNAQVLLRSGFAVRANKELLTLSGKDVEPLKLLTSLRLKGSSPDKIIRQARQKIEKLDKAEQFPYWAIIANASWVKRDYKGRIRALEKVVSAREKNMLLGYIYTANVNTLWDAYFEYGKNLKQKIKPVTDEKSLFQAAEAYRENNIFNARSLFAYLAINSRNKDLQDAAHRGLVGTLYLNQNGYRIVNRLYLDSRRFPNIGTIPASVRHMMTGKALKTSDIKLASRLLQGQIDVPKGINELDWHLRRARVHILAGEFQQGMEVLLGIFEIVEKLNNKQVDKLLQVLFDLQAMGKHRTVFPLFEIVMKRTQDKKRKREILYWMADSMKSLEEYAEAAHFYLKSAGVADAVASDLWAQSARFQAAEALVNAGLVVDAKTLLERLLKVTKDPGRKALLERKIAQINTSKNL